MIILDKVTNVTNDRRWQPKIEIYLSLLDTWKSQNQRNTLPIYRRSPPGLFAGIPYNRARGGGR
ncbi:hypothetical protein H6P81_017090 [Aristolochia fimbriata]|uniref:Uncharacterized protein n=1 Tax=Aristolochia fimbriata TaxID=158543 RepID=A0AAV7E064_ARIFI|nr:hypothetical protein H6P81_017090 [Aristolochia fimbriata]